MFRDLGDLCPWKRLEAPLEMFSGPGALWNEAGAKTTPGDRKRSKDIPTRFFESSGTENNFQELPETSEKETSKTFKTNNFSILDPRARSHVDMPLPEDRARFVPLFFSVFARARQCPKARARRSAESPRRAPVAPKGSQRRARVVRCAEQRELAGWLIAGKALAAGQSDDGRARRWAERSTEFQRRALVAPRGSQRRARVVRGARPNN